MRDVLESAWGQLGGVGIGRSVRADGFDVGGNWMGGDGSPLEAQSAWAWGSGKPRAWRELRSSAIRGAR